jgi:hypothetical protein
MVYFQTKNPNLGKFWRALELKVLLFIIWSILQPFGIFYGHLVYFMDIWYILWTFGNVVVIKYIFPLLVYILCQEKSDNPGPVQTLKLPSGPLDHDAMASWAK